MTIAIPDLDTIDFEALAEEARGRIPRYAPSWTDHNLHDPGITLLELLAWVTDQQIYQVGFVSDEHRRAFAKLLGVTAAPARPARGLLWPGAAAALEADLAANTQAMVTERVDLPFLIDIACRLSTAELTGITGEGELGPISLMTTGQQEGASFPIQSTGGQRLRSLVLSFDRAILTAGADGTPAGTVTLGVEIENPALTPGDDLSQVPRWGPLVIEHRVAGGDWRPLRIIRDDTHALLRSGVIALQMPATPGVTFAELRLRLDLGFFPSAPRISRLGLNALPVVQLERRETALLQPGTGLPDQIQSLPLGGLVAASGEGPAFEIEVADAGVWERWSEASMLQDLGPDDRRFVLDLANDVLCFGNGINGKAPPLGAQIRHLSYHLTLGQGGNLREGLVWRLQGQGMTWKNTSALSGGEDAWSADRVGIEARRKARHPAVITDDAVFRNELLGLKGFAIARADILPRRHPALPEEDLAGHRTVVVLPERARDEDLSERDAGLFLGALRGELSARRLAGERLHVVLPDIRTVQVRAHLLIDPSGRAEDIEADARRLLGERLAPLPPRDGPADRGWPLGQRISAGQLAGLLAGHDQVIAVTSLELSADGSPFAAEDIVLSMTELPRGGDHQFVIQRLTAETGNAAG